MNICCAMLQKCSLRLVIPSLSQCCHSHSRCSLVEEADRRGHGNRGIGRGQIWCIGCIGFLCIHFLVCAHLYAAAPTHQYLVFKPNDSP